MNRIITSPKVLNPSIRQSKMEKAQQEQNNYESLPTIQNTQSIQNYVYTPQELFLTNTKPHSQSPRENRKKNNSLDHANISRNRKQYKKEFAKKDKQRKIFNKLYGLTDQYLDLFEKAKRKKYLPLEEYQNNMLDLFSTRDIDKDCFYDLSNKFRDIRTEANEVCPLPPVNFDAIYQHSKENKERKEKEKRMSLRQLLENKVEKDAFEKEMDSIKFSRSQNKSKKFLNKNLLMLPQHIVDTLNEKLKLCV